MRLLPGLPAGCAGSGAVDLQAVDQRGELLLTGRRGDAAEDQLGTQLPAGRDLPGLGNGLVDDRVVMLQAGADAETGQNGPNDVLVHGIGVLGPDREVLGIEGKLFLQALDDILVLEEQHGAGTGGKGCQLVAGRLELVGRNDGGQAFSASCQSFSCSAQP